MHWRESTSVSDISSWRIFLFNDIRASFIFDSATSRQSILFPGRRGSIFAANLAAAFFKDVARPRDFGASKYAASSPSAKATRLVWKGRTGIAFIGLDAMAKVA
jgi:hypothetical protein